MMQRPQYVRGPDGKWPDDVVVYTMISHADHPCTAYRRAFSVYMRAKKPEVQERWKRILTQIKSQFPEGGCP